MTTLVGFVCGHKLQVAEKSDGNTDKTEGTCFFSFLKRKG
jgi:hypothetical protein